MKKAGSCTPAIYIFLLLFVVSGCASFSALGVDRIREEKVIVERSHAYLDGYRIVFVSDIHFANNFSRARLDTLIRSINAQKPDCIILGGDFTLGFAEIEEFAEAASVLVAREGVFAVLGNHDFFNGRQKTIQSLREAGIIVLDETALELPSGIVMAGINDFTDVFPVLNALDDVLIPGAFVVMASHNPDFAEKTDMSRYNLVLSGHMHGGQITFFGWAPIIPSQYGQKYRTGTIYKDGVQVIISNGAGYGGMLFRFRLGAPSDFLLITLSVRDRMTDS